MKKLLIGVIITTASTLALADSDTGCGVGSMIFKGQSGIAPHVLAATTNGSFGNQTFGMTFGTLGCNANAPITSMAMYMNNNMDNIAKDMSRGQGENITTLAILLKVKKADQPEFNALMKKNFSKIFPSDKTTSDQAVKAIIATMKSDTKLAKYVS
jgi:hypothetical protein